MSGRGNAPSAARDPKHYVHGIDGPVAIVSARVAHWLHQQFDLEAVRLEVRGMDPDVDNALIALRVCATAWRASAYGTTPRNLPAPAPKSSWLTTTEVADLLDQTDRGVRMACSSGRLPAERDGGRWRISREDFEHYRAARAQRAA